MKLVEYIKETRAEMKHVTWPTRKQAVNYTFLVIGVSTATALILALADKMFALGLERIILNK
jgi:preprotein translocase subunit SecE